MSKISVSCTLTAYSTALRLYRVSDGILSTEHTLTIKSAKDYKECILIDLEGKEFRVYASELKMAIDNALNAH